MCFSNIDVLPINPTPSKSTKVQFQYKMPDKIKINLVPFISPELPQRDRSACFEDCF